MDYEKLYPGRFLKSADFDGKDVTLTVKAVRAEKVDDKMKAIMSFEGTDKELVLNRTNAEAVKLMFGRETNDWLGKRITWFPLSMANPFGDGNVTAVRVRGSPDLAKPLTATVQRGRKTINVKVQPTGPQKGGAQQAAAPANGIPTEEEQREIRQREQANS
jgi:glucose-6-phosphate dehydrogenase assembly protein OpcA